jgi:macrolide transport system ATP-binding/permease protein
MRKLSDFSAEIQAHIRLEADRLRAEGMSESDALEAAQRRFGNVVAAQERFYEHTSQPWLEHLLQDLRYAARLLMRNPSFTIAAVLTLALGIGANTAIFTAVDALALRPLPFSDPSRLMSIETRKVDQAEIEPWTSKLDFDDLRRQTRSFSAIAGISPVWNVIMTGQGDAERLETLYVSHSFFPILDVKPKLGRGITPEDDRAGARPVVVLSHEFWVRRFGGDGSILGRQLALDGGVYSVVGVLPRGFQYPGEPVAGKASTIEVWLPLSANPLDTTPRGVRYLKVIGCARCGGCGGQR